MKYLKRAISILTLLVTMSVAPVLAQPEPDPNFCECPEGYIIDEDCEYSCDQDPEVCCVENTIPLQKSEANAILIGAGFCLVCISYYKQNKKSKNLPLHDTAQDS